jgi:hypothetical protein
VFAEIAQFLGCCGVVCNDGDASVLACLRTQNTTAMEVATLPFWCFRTLPLRLSLCPSQAADRKLNLHGGFLSWSPVIDGVEVIGTYLFMSPHHGLLDSTCCHPR